MVLNEPLISIVMCTHNRAAYIQETIESIQAQTFTDWELLIMDNGSTDNTEAVVHAIHDSRISYYKYDPTTTGRLRNMAFDKARGSYISLMDSDDLWLPQKLQKQLDLLKDNTGIKFSFTNSRDFINDREVVHTLNKRTTGTEVSNTFLPFIKNEILPPIQTFLFHKDCLNVCGKFGETRIFNDYEFIGNITYHFDAAIVYEPLLLRRLHNSNSVDMYSESLAEEYMDAIASFKKRKMLPAAIADQLLFIANINLGNVHLSFKRWGKAFANYRRAWPYKPLSVIPCKKMGKAILYSLKHKIT